MAKNDNLTDFLTDVADAIREKKDTTELINPQNFSEEIRGLRGSPWDNVELTIIDQDTFGPAAIISIVLKEGIRVIANNAFSNSQIKKITFPKTVEVIGKYVFERTNLEEIVFDACILKSVGQVAWPSTPSTKIIVNDMSAWCKCIFTNSSQNPISAGHVMYDSKKQIITHIDIPEDISEVNPYTLGLQWNYLLSVTVLGNLKTIHPYGFYDNSRAQFYDFSRQTIVPTLEDVNAFYNIGYIGTGKIVVPDALYDEWIAATNWSSLASRIVKASEFVEPTKE